MSLIPTLSWNIFSIFFFILCFVGSVQLLFVLMIHSRLAFFKGNKSSENPIEIPVSIIIAARNESDNLYENLPSILAQDYPNFEVIVVNNQSIDDSSWLLNAFCREYPNLKVVELGKNKHLRPGKKLSITLAIKGAKYEHFILTDADCKPASNQWLRQMAGTFSNTKQVVLGYGPSTAQKGFLNKVVRFDTAWIGVNYMSMALARLPYMGVGRNLAYTKTVFESVNGFKSHYGLPSGDDDLFIQEAARKSNYTIQIDPATYCFSPPPNTWKTWQRQKNRHYSTSSRYKFIKKSLLGIYPLSLLLMWISFVILLCNFSWAIIASIIFGVILLFKWILQARCLLKLHEKGFVWAFPLWDLGYAILAPMMYYISDRKRYYKW